MADKKITDLQPIDEVTGDVNFPGDDTIQTYRVTAAQMLAYIKANITLPTTGDFKPTLKTVADNGWIMCDDGTIGSASSGATTRANADTQDLYTLLWNNLSDTYAPVTGGRGASASADWAANKPIALTKMLGRALGIAGSGSSLTARSLGQTLGAETHTLDQTEMPSHTHIQNAHSHSGSVRYPPSSNNLGLQSGAPIGYLDSTNFPSATATNQNTGGGAAHNNMQPTTFINVMIKL